MRRAVVLDFTNQVRDGKLTIVGRGSVGRPVISAVEVLQQLSRGTCRPVTSGAAASGGPATRRPSPLLRAPSSPATTPAPSSTVPTAQASSAAVSARPDSSLPAAAGSAMGMLSANGGRPFSTASAWNTPVAPTPSSTRAAPRWCAPVAPSNRATAILYAYGDPVFTAVAGTPTATVDRTENWGTAGPHPRRPQPTSGSDGRVIVIDLTAGTS